eukprot:jgi/Botrbrau1/21496/Bobra.174_2s0005.1
MQRNNSSMLFNLEEEDGHGHSYELLSGPSGFDSRRAEDLRKLLNPDTIPHQMVRDAVETLSCSHDIQSWRAEDWAKYLAECLQAEEWKIYIRTANPAISGPELPKTNTDTVDGQRTLVVHNTHQRTASGAREGGSEILRNLRHVYILCKYAGVEEVIVDPTFIQQFDIKNPSLEFEHMMLVLPRVLVLPVERVEVVVELLASGMSACFRAANIDMPPWRRPDAMLSKWVPRRSIDLLQQTPPTSPKASFGARGVSFKAARQFEVVKASSAALAFEASTALGVSTGRLGGREALSLMKRDGSGAATGKIVVHSPKRAGTLSLEMAAKAEVQTVAKAPGRISTLSSASVITNCEVNGDSRGHLGLTKASYRNFSKCMVHGMSLCLPNP